MAFDATTLLEARAAIENAQTAGVTRNELRMPNFGAFKAHVDNAPLLIPGLDITDLRKYTGQPTKIPVLVKGAAGSGTTRKCAGQGTGTTAMKSLSFNTIVEEFAVSYLASATNQMDYQKQFNFQLAERLRSGYTRLETLSAAHLETIKATINNGTRYSTTVAGAKRVPFADYNRLFGRLTTEMMGNDFSGLADIVASPNLADAWSYVLRQGAANGENLGFQVDDFRPYFSRFVNDGTGVDSTAYLFTPGTIGVFPWTNQLHRDGKDIGTDVWTTFTDPVMGITWELKVKRGCADSSATVAGGEADYVESFVLSAEFAFTEAYSSNGDTGVYKYEVLDQV
ncbi:hypothetical protein [Hymenobacter guriensis]|uniref:Phage major capsid protein n=1 Tax=Hymenobacter guriensis TaxID=2793065 RepID=A0ABS0L7P1_9BACT|nr:hypothetical protein [Hymenobacter guriensis]MBG8556165.1 hypothetical protein [Hymenobacter guriensis]